MISSLKRTNQQSLRRKHSHDSPIQLVIIRDDFDDEISDFEEDIPGLYSGDNDRAKAVDPESVIERRSLSSHATGVSLESIFNSKCSISSPRKPLRREDSRRHSFSSNTTSSSFGSLFGSTSSSDLSPRKPIRCPTPTGPRDSPDEAGRGGHIRM